MNFLITAGGTGEKINSVRSMEGAIIDAVKSARSPGGYPAAGDLR